MSMSIFCVHNTNQSMANCFEDIFKSNPCILTVLISLFGNFFPTDKGFSLTSLVGNAQWYFEKKINKKVHKKSSLHLLNAPRFPVKSHASNWYKNITFSNMEMLNSFRLLLFWGLLFYVTHENISVILYILYLHPPSKFKIYNIWRHHHCQWRAA